MPLNIGMLDSLVTIEKKSVTRDAVTGAEVVTWTPTTTAWARVVESATASDESLRSGMATYARPTRVLMRWREDVDPTMRVDLGSGRYLQITGTAQIGRREGLEMACKEWAHG
jgi:SPP1 family predicted phage head-tail adaptor